MGATDTIAPPPGIARRFVRAVVGFGIGVGVGMAPFLGKVAGVDALLDLFPQSLKAPLIIFSSFLMGIIAAAVQFYAGERIARPLLRRRFRHSLIALLAGLFSFVVLYEQLVVRVPVDGGRDSEPVVIAFSRTPGCGCAPALSDVECITALSTDPRAIESCWGGGPLRLARNALRLSYLLLTGGFGALIGLLLLQEEAQRRAREPRAGAGTAGSRGGRRSRPKREA